MPTVTWDHVHLRSPDPEATAQWFERMLGAEVIRSTQQGKPRIDLKLGGAKMFIAPVAPATASTRPGHALSGARSYRAIGDRARRHRRRAQGQGRRIHQAAADAAAGH